MKQSLVVVVTVLCTAAGAHGAHPTDPFWSWWGDGKAELSSYSVVQPRYGEARAGHTVLVFVTEDVSRHTRIKAESNRVAPEDRMPVLKLNRIHKFVTGIYDYSVMTSTFSSVNAELGQPPFTPVKVSFTSQEWCGQVARLAILRPPVLHLTSHSYFEREGDRQEDLRVPDGFMLEDNLLIWIRELKGPVMEPGAERSMPIFPAMWHLRTGRDGAGFTAGTIRKSAGPILTVAGASHPSVEWTWQVNRRTETTWVEAAYPHRILKWESSTGASGVLLKSLRLPYWQTNGKADEHYRVELGISD